jgi:hypothetical protein
MVFEIICLMGLIFVVVTLPGALRRRGGGASHVPPVINDVVPSQPYWQKKPTATALARDRQEVLEMWAKNNADPNNFPAPIPPTKPHPYFGNEANADEVD